MRVGQQARVSTRDQSCDLQLRELRAYCAARLLIVVREYVDAAVSGTKDSRPQLNELMGDVRKRKVDAVICWRFDRFARCTKHLLLALDGFRALGVGFISYQENIDTSTPLGQALFVIIAAIAELERGLICERVTAGIRNARAKGKRLGRPCRYVDMDRVVELQVSVQSQRQIAAVLNIGYGTVRERLHASERETYRRAQHKLTRLLWSRLCHEASEKFVIPAQKSMSIRSKVAATFQKGSMAMLTFPVVCTEQMGPLRVPFVYSRLNLRNGCVNKHTRRERSSL